MATSRISVVIAEPVKTEGKWYRPGDTAIVGPDTAAQLARDGCLAEGPGEGATGLPGFDEAVAATAKAIAEEMVGAAVDEAFKDHEAALNEARAAATEAGLQRDQLQARVQELQSQIEGLTGDRNAARLRADEAEAEVRSLQARNHELEAQIAEAADADPSAEEPAEDTPKPSPKKGAKTKG
ncbi:hypothetical protein [Paracoccus spongiarum]|uniref:Uncharacterized protein n=1 Tax=Paracoccus spongiarum TaxID=3064387 RepID=A0ABT9JE67_9RHOB|nr:hypothetical protein [Paracoccus sp. 2205BS29-5]MDP5307920.1 hypothetical protein [Paracoccus sp. 2205BS29-5]